VSTYTTAETALLALVRSYGAGLIFTEENSAAEDTLVLDAGTGVAAIVAMAGESVEGDKIDDYGEHGAYVERHQIAVWVCVERGTGDGGDGAISQECKALTESVKDYLRPYERLNGAPGVLRAQIVRTGAPDLISRSTAIEDATHVAQEVVFSVLCAGTYEPTEAAEA
jgi:hypothetical protein